MNTEALLAMMLSHILSKTKIIDKSALWGPMGPDWTTIAHTQLDNGTNNMGP